MSAPLHMRGSTTHARKGAIQNAFTYGVDYLLIDPERTGDVAPLFRRNARALMSLWDADHGGARAEGTGVAWAREVFGSVGLKEVEIRLLAQPRFLGYWFNPVAFWLAFRGDALVAVIAEVNNTVGDRHSYLCAKPDFAAIGPSDRMETQKVFHVSPFLEISGDYHFRFQVTDDHISIVIDHTDGNKGLVATLSGPLDPATRAGLTRAALRRPMGALRVMALILWQAAKLKLKGATFRKRTPPPVQEVSHGH